KNFTPKRGAAGPRGGRFLWAGGDADVADARPEVRERRFNEERVVGLMQAGEEEVAVLIILHPVAFDGDAKDVARLVGRLARVGVALANLGDAAGVQLNGKIQAWKIDALGVMRQADHPRPGGFARGKLVVAVAAADRLPGAPAPRRAPGAPARRV